MKEGNAAIEEFKAKRGQYALEAQDGVRQRLTEIGDKYGGQLPPYLKHKFDQAYRPYQERYWDGQIRTHSIKEGYDVGKTTNTTSQQLAIDHAAINYNNPLEVEHALADARLAAEQQLKLDGMLGIPGAVAEAHRRSDTAVHSAVAEAMNQHDAPGALKYVEAHRAELGVAYGPLQ